MPATPPIRRRAALAISGGGAKATVTLKR